MCQLSVLDTVRKLLEDGSKGKHSMLIGILLVVLSNYLQPLTNTTDPFNSPNVLLWLGLFAFIYGLCLYTQKETELHEEVRETSPNLEYRIQFVDMTHLQDDAPSVHLHLVEPLSVISSQSERMQERKKILELQKCQHKSVTT